MTSRARNADLSEAQALGLALKQLREREGMTQQQAADAMEPPVTPQAWQRYERGERQVILRSDLQEKVAAAVKATPAELQKVRDMLLGFPGGEPLTQARVLTLPIWGRARAGVAGPQIYDVASEPESTIDLSVLLRTAVKTLRVAGDSMTGYVESGQVVIYDRDRWPRRGDGCVVELKSGDVLVKEYDKSDGSNLFLRQRFPDEGVTVPMSEVAGVYTIIARLSL